MISLLLSTCAERPLNRTGAPNTFYSLIAAAGLPRCPLARPWGRRLNIALVCADCLSNTFNMLPALVERRMPTCSALSVKLIVWPPNDRGLAALQ